MITGDSHYRQRLFLFSKGVIIEGLSGYYSQFLVIRGWAKHQSPLNTSGFFLSIIEDYSNRRGHLWLLEVLRVCGKGSKARLDGPEQSFHSITTG